MSSKISLGPLKMLLKIICRKILIIRKLCILAGKDHLRLGELNCDGACKGNGEHAGCDGLLRQSNGTWIKGFSRKIGACDALHAEMWGLYLGLDMTWREGISHLIVESDSKVLIDMVTNNCKINGTIPSLVQRIQQILR